MWGWLSPGSLCIIPVRYKVGPESHWEAVVRLFSVMRFGGEKPRFYLLLLVRTTQEKALKKLMATVNVVYHLGEILKKWAFCLFLTWDGVRSRSNGRGYFAE